MGLDPQGLIAVDLRDRSLLWHNALDGGVVHAPIFMGASAIVGTKGGSVARVDFVSGEVQWLSSMDDWVTARPVQLGEWLAVITHSGRVALLDAASGSVVKETRLPGRVVNAPAHVHDRLVVRVLDPRDNSPDGQSSIVSLNSTTLAVQWSLPLRGNDSSAPIAVGGGVVVSTSDGKTRLLSSTTGEVLWTHDGPPGPRSTPTYVEGIVVVSTWGGHIIGLEADTGKARWTRVLDNWALAPGVAVCHRLALATYSGQLLILSTHTGHTLFASTSPEVDGAPSPVALQDGLVAAAGRQIVHFAAPEPDCQ